MATARQAKKFAAIYDKDGREMLAMDRRGMVRTMVGVARDSNRVLVANITFVRNFQAAYYGQTQTT